MLRALLAVVACFLLGGCWMSEERFFGDGDWAKLDIDGLYEVEAVGGNPSQRVTLKSRADGMFAIITQDPNDRDDDYAMGLVPIEGGSGRFFLLVDRTNPDDGDFYYIAQLSDQDGLNFFYPDCEGTPAMDGLETEDGGKTGTFCSFANAAALMKAALQAEQFLSRRYIVAVTPVYALRRISEEVAQEDATAD